MLIHNVVKKQDEKFQQVLNWDLSVDQLTGSLLLSVSTSYAPAWRTVCEITKDGYIRRCSGIPTHLGLETMIGGVVAVKDSDGRLLVPKGSSQ